MTPDAEAWDRAPVALLRLDHDGTVLVTNRTLLRWLDLPEDDVVGRRLSQLLTVGGRIYWETHLGPLLRMQDGVDEVAVELQGRAGRRPVLLSARRRADGVDVALSGATERSRYERELLAARAAAEVSAGRLATLQRVTAALSVAPGVEAAGRALLRTAVDDLEAAGAVLWLLDEQGGLARHRATGTATTVGGAGRTPPPLRTLHGSARVLDDGSVVVPLTAPNRTAGALVLLPPTTPPDGGWPPDVDLLTGLGRQSGVALERAALQDRSASVAHELQRALLGVAVPQDDRYALTTIYRPGVQALEVGGDWYDVFLVREGVLAVSVGDVVGRGLRAATAMGQLRSAVRAVADEGGPSAVLTRLDRFVERTGVGFMATLSYAEVDLASGDVVYACAGHLPPLLVAGPDLVVGGRRAGGASFLWEGRSLPLGVRGAGGRREQARTRLQPGDRVLLYTDGLVERRDRPLDQGLDGLATAAAALGTAPVNRLVTGALTPPGAEQDDVCLLALTWFGPRVGPQRLARRP